MAPSLSVPRFDIFSKPFLIGLYCSIGGFLYGFDSGVLTPTLVAVEFNRYFNNPNADIRGALVSIYQGGGFIGAFLAGQIGDKLGRRKTIFLGAILGIVGSILMCAATHMAMLLVGRILVGVAVSVMTSATPVYAAEIARKNERGRLSACSQLLVALGFFVANWTGYGFKSVSGAAQWRVPFALQAVPSAFLAAGVLFLPESPRWLCMKGREEEARVIIHKLHGSRDDHDTCEETFMTIRDSVRADLAVDDQVTWPTILKTPSLRKRLYFGSMVWIAKVVAGLSFVQYFSPFIYRALNFSPNQVLLVTGLYGCMSPICVFLSFFWVDRIGRKTLLIYSSTGWTIAFATLTALTAVYPPIAGTVVNVAAQRASVACVFSISVFHSTGAGPIAWTYPSEVFTTQMRSRANGFTQGSNYLLSVMMTQLAPRAFEAMGWKFYTIFIVTNFLCVIAFCFFPETRGKNLEDIAKIFGDDNRDIVSKKVIAGGAESSDASINKGSRDEIEEAQVRKVER